MYDNKNNEVIGDENMFITSAFWVGKFMRYLKLPFIYQITDKGGVS